MKMGIESCKKLSRTTTPSYRKQQSGFTLIEMLIGIMILGTAISLLSMSISQSVRQQEKMNALLDIYQVALTVKPEIQAEMETGELGGVIQQGELEVRWQASLLSEKREAEIIDLESGQSRSAGRLIKLYEIEVWIENLLARRVFTFKHAQKEVNRSSNSPLFQGGRR